MKAACNGTDAEIRDSARALGFPAYADVALKPNDIGLGPGVGIGEGEGEGEPQLSVADARLLESGFADADANDDDRLTLPEARTALASLTQGQFDLLDSNSDSFVTVDEIRAYIDANTEVPGGCNFKSSAMEQTRKYLGDLFLFGLALVALGLARRLSAGSSNL